jgi:hypothetical protein
MSLESNLPSKLVKQLRPRKFRRSSLIAGLDPNLFEKFASETTSLLERRFEKLAIEFDSIDKTNFNPWILLITAPVYNIYSPLEVAERLQLAKAFHGDDTAFGRFGEERILKEFGAIKPIEKSDPEFSAIWSPIDLSIDVEGQRYLISLKAGPWTMNQGHANEMEHRFPQIHEQTGAKIVIGVMYGRYEKLSNKPQLVENRLGNPDWFDYLVGRDFWEFVSGVENVHKEIFKAILKGQQSFAAAHRDETFQEKLLANRIKMASSLRMLFDVDVETDFWETLFNNMF